MKTCTICKSERPLFDFVKCSRNKSGLSARCKPCARDISKEREKTRLYTPEQIARKRAYHAEWTAARKGTDEWAIARRDANAKWLEANAPRKRATNAAWKAANKPKVMADTRFRQAKQQLATPPWCDRKEIESIYELAAEFRAAGFDVQVDHIVPLRGRNVSGLHVPQNLRLCLAKHNQSKGNKLDEALL